MKKKQFNNNHLPKVNLFDLILKKNELLFISMRFFISCLVNNQKQNLLLIITKPQLRVIPGKFIFDKCRKHKRNHLYHELFTREQPSERSYLFFIIQKIKRKFVIINCLQCIPNKSCKLVKQKNNIMVNLFSFKPLQSKQTSKESKFVYKVYIQSYSQTQRLQNLILNQKLLLISSCSSNTKNHSYTQNKQYQEKYTEGDWSSGMILVLGTRGPGFNSRIAPFFLLLQMTWKLFGYFSSEYFCDFPSFIFLVQQQLIPKINFNIVNIRMNLLVSRAPALRALTIAGVLYYGLTSYANSSQQSILTIQDYLGTEIKQKDTFSIIGILKPRSVKLATGLNKKFTITDHKNEIRCSLKTPITTQFKEGQTLIVSGYCPDLSKKNIITVKQFVTKHSMQNREWEARRNVDKKNYGLQSFK